MVTQPDRSPVTRSHHEAQCRLWIRTVRRGTMPFLLETITAVSCEFSAVDQLVSSGDRGP